METSTSLGTPALPVGPVVSATLALARSLDGRDCDQNGDGVLSRAKLLGPKDKFSDGENEELVEGDGGGENDESADDDVDGSDQADDIDEFEDPDSDGDDDGDESRAGNDNGDD